MFVWHVLCVVVFFVLEYITRWIVTRDTSAFTLEYFGVLKRTGFGDLENKVLCTSMHGEVHLCVPLGEVHLYVPLGSYFTRTLAMQASFGNQFGAIMIIDGVPHFDAKGKTVPTIVCTW